MQRRLILLKQLSKLYALKRFGERYFQSEPIVQSENLPKEPKRLGDMIANCHLCHLAKLRKNALIGAGAMKNQIMIVIDEPSAREDETGRWFCGDSGEMLKNMIEKAMGLTIDDVYVAAAIKCHSRGKADAAVLAACKSYLVAEVERLKPKIIIALGKQAFSALCESNETIEAARGRLWRCAFDRAMVAPSFSLGYLRLNQNAKKEAVADLRLALNAIDKTAIV
ncbi:MAG: uracil-DNA glycosylase [Helicobacteraceae bacterium]|jgi:DNA polymerase|nr:uracil-DNA glycosylase [Helicobacteraceae bacterium]